MKKKRIIDFPEEKKHYSTNTKINYPLQMDDILQSNEIRKYLKKNNFYSYKMEIVNLSKRITKRFIHESKQSNQRNLILKKRWKEINSLGKPRNLVSMDLGGTNLNLHNIKVKNNNKISITNSKSVDFYQNKIYTPQILFKDLKKQLDNLILKKDREKLTSLVFIFSFPIKQIIRKDGRIDAIVTDINKRHKSKGLIGLQIGISLQKFLNTNGYPKINVTVTNDSTINCLAAKHYEIQNKTTFDAAISIIVGTGTNIAIGQDVHTKDKKTSLQISNLEFGDFSEVKLSHFDKILNNSCDTKNRYLVEKMISGTWQHELFKIMINDLIKNKIIPKRILSGVKINNISAEQIEKMISTNKIKKSQKQIFKLIWKEINKRGASICGITIANIMIKILKKSKKEKIKVIIVQTGSVIKKSLGFREHLFDSIDCELERNKKNKHISYQIINIENKSAIGSTIFDLSLS